MCNLSILPLIGGQRTCLLISHVFYLFRFGFVPAALLQLLNRLFSERLFVVPLRRDPIHCHYQCSDPPIFDASFFFEKLKIYCTM